MYPPQNTEVFASSSRSGKSTIMDILPTVICTADAMTPTTHAILDALSGITTQTTPTLTPSTLRSIEESLNLVEPGDGLKVSHQKEAGFVPPLVPPSSIHTASSKKQQVVYIVSEMREGVTRNTDRRLSVSSNSSCSSDATTCVSKGRRSGGRRKEDFEKESLLPVEEQERRRLRRERNKQAAARCRKRRMDLTSSLEQETDELEEKKSSLQKEIRQLMQEKDELEAVLRDHSAHCKIPKLDRSTDLTEALSENHVFVKQEADDDSNDSYHSEDTDPDSIEKFVKPVPPPLCRPTSLPVAPLYSPRVKKPFEIAGVAITTPSSGIPGFNFDSLVEGVTGFTPIGSSPSPSCATQQRSFLLPVDLSSPESANRKLIS